MPESPSYVGGNNKVRLDKKVREVLSGYHYEVDCSTERQWHEAIQGFDDASLYQTWTYEAVRSGEKNMSHLILKRDGQIVAMAQVRILKIAILKAGIAYIKWGPIWNLSGYGKDLTVFRQMLRSLRNEYVLNRGLVLRLVPYLFEDDAKELVPVLTEEGYGIRSSITSSRTALMDLSPSIELLRADLDQKWRNHLNAAQRKGLAIVEGYGDDLFELLIHVYDEMVERKRFSRPNDINEIREIQKRLPPELKMRIMLCSSEGKLAGGALCSTIGSFGMSIYRATSDIGRKLNASYLLQWRIIEWVKQQNCFHYNVNGINPERNPGTYSFKMGLCGRQGKDVHYLGTFDSYGNAFQAYAVKLPEKLKFINKLVKSRLRNEAPSSFPY